MQYLLLCKPAVSPCHDQTSHLNKYFNHQTVVADQFNVIKLGALSMGSLHILRRENLEMCGIITVTSIEYCYKTSSDNLNTLQGVFDLILLTENGNSFTVKRKTSVVTTPQMASPAAQ